jgi:hypothetical protein
VKMLGCGSSRRSVSRYSIFSINNVHTERALKKMFLSAWGYDYTQRSSFCHKLMESFGLAKVSPEMISGDVLV